MDTMLPPMRFRESLPTSDLAGVVACFWEFVAGPDTPAGYIHTVPPDGCTSVSCLAGRGPVGLLGPRLLGFKLPVFPNSTYIGIRFRPGATRGVLGKSGAQLRDCVGLLGQFAPGLDAPFIDALKTVKSLEEAQPELEGVVRAWCGRSGDNDALVLAVASAIGLSKGATKVSDLAARSGLSERQLQRRFREEVGLTPKQYARIVRLRAAAVDMAIHGAGSWGDVAAERGFADQAHLVREFAHIFGMTPTEFRKEFAPAIEHVDVTP